MNNTKLEDIRRKLQSKIDRVANHISASEVRFQNETWMFTTIRKEQSENKRLMAALIHLQRENKQLNEECNLFAESVVRRFMGEGGL